jgi:hypothetical protein
VLALLALAGLVLVSIHPHKEVRYGATALPLVTLMGALGLGRLIFGRGIPARGGSRGRLIAGSLLGLGIVAAGVVTWLSGETGERLDRRLAGEYALYTGDPRVLPLLEPLAERVGPKGRVGVVGAVDELSADLVRWALAREHGAAAPRVGELRKRFDPRAPREEWWPRVERWLETEGLDRVLVLRLDPDSPWARRDDYRMHNAWQAVAAQALVGAYPPRVEPVRALEIGLTADVLEIDRSRGPEHQQGETR